MKSTAAVVTTLCFSLLFTASCSDKEEEAARNTSPQPIKTEQVKREVTFPISIATSNYPVTYFAEQIAGDLGNVTFPIEMDGDPAFWEPTQEGISQFQNADMIIFNGAGFEKWAIQVTLPESKIVDASSVFEAQYIAGHDTATHSHGPGGEHSHGTIDFTTWLDPRQAIQQAESIEKALSKYAPAKQDEFKTNLESLKASLTELDQNLEALFEGKSDTSIIASHPVYDYMARRYDLDIESLHWEPDLFPDEEQWKSLQEMISEDPAYLIIWEDTPLPETAEKLQEIGLTSIVFNPCGNTPAKGDYLSVMSENINNLKTYFEKSADR